MVVWVVIGVVTSPGRLRQVHAEGPLVVGCGCQPGSLLKIDVDARAATRH